MGLDTTHDCWSGAYSAFKRWRDQIAETAGYTFFVADGEYMTSVKEINWAALDDKNYAGEWDRIPEDPLIMLLAHSDCDGVIHPEHARLIADRLEWLLPRLPMTEAVGHIGRLGWQGTTERFINGLRAAVQAGEDVEFG